MQLVADYGALSSAHIYALREAKTAGAIRRLQERLSRLFHNGYLHRPVQQFIFHAQRHFFAAQYGQDKSSHYLVYTLSQKGADEIFLDDPERRKQISWQTRLHNRQYLNLWHALMVAEFHVTLSLLERGSEGIKLGEWRQGEDINRQAPQVAVPSKKGMIKKAIKPDAYFTLEKDGQVRHFFLEADRSTMTTIRFTEKLKAYWRLWKEKKHTQHFGIGERVGFRVLTTTISEARAVNLCRAAKESDDTRSGSNMFYFTCAHYVDFEHPDSLLQAIWKTPAGEEKHSLV